MKPKQKPWLGTVTEKLPGGKFRVRIHRDDKEVVAYMGGRFRRAKVTIVVGDEVDVILDEQGGTDTNRIVWRF